MSKTLGMVRRLRALALLGFLLSSLALTGWASRILFEPCPSGWDGSGGTIWICPPSFEDWIAYDSEARKVLSGGLALLGVCAVVVAGRLLLRKSASS